MSKRNAILQPLGLATVLTLGFGILIAIIVGWSMSFLRVIIIAGPTDKLEILLDGTPAIVRNFEGSAEYRGLDGKIIEVPKYDVFSHSERLIGPPVLKIQIDVPLVGRERIRAFSDQLTPATFWYFIHDGKLDGKGYFIGYDSSSKRRVGYIGRSGFCENMPSAENWFPMDGRKMSWGIYPNTFDYGLITEPGGDSQPGMDIPLSNVVMISGDQLLQIDLRTRSVSTLMKSPDMISIRRIDAYMPMPNNPLPDNSRRHCLAVRTLDKVILFNAAGKQVHTYEIPEDLRKRSFILYDLGDEKALISYSKGYPYPSNHEELTWIETTGKILRHEEVTLAGHKSYVNEIWGIALVLPEPIVLLFCAMLNPLIVDVQATYTDALAQSLLDYSLPLAVLCILSAGLAWICYRRQRQMALPWTWVWVGFVFLCGVPGLLAYLFHRRWPVLEKCNVCDHAVPRDREKCAACGSEFPSPAPKGIEVFA